MATPLAAGSDATPLATASEQLRASNGSSALAAAIAAAEAKNLPPPPAMPSVTAGGAAAAAPAMPAMTTPGAAAPPAASTPSAAGGSQAAPRPPVTAPTLPSLGAAAAKAPVTLARRVQPAPVAKDSDDDDDLDIQASTKSLKDTPVEPPPPPGSRITVRFSDGIDYGGTVQKLLDGNKAFVLYDDGQSEAVQFPDSDVKVTRVGPGPPKRVPLRARLATAVPPSDEDSDDDALDRAALLSKPVAWPGDKAPSKPRTRGRKRPAPPKDDDSSSDALEDIICEACKRGDDEANLIECDAGCGRWRHLQCCAPPLSSVPEVWACPACSLPREEGVACRGDVVFAKFAHYPWWPATIRSLKTDTVRISKQPQRRGQLTGVNIDVLYVGRDVNATVDALRCVPFESGLSEMRSYARATKGSFDNGDCPRDAFREAVQLAVDKCAARKAARNNSTDVAQYKQALLDKCGVASKLLLVPDTDDDEPVQMTAAPPVPFAQQPLARPVIAQPKKRSTASGRESTSSRDGHLWYAAMLRVGIDEATALEAVRERLDCSEAFAKQVVRQKAQRRSSTSLRTSPSEDDYAKPRVQLRATSKRQRGLPA